MLKIGDFFNFDFHCSLTVQGFLDKKRKKERMLYVHNFVKFVKGESLFCWQKFGHQTICFHLIKIDRKNSQQGTA